jgi:hypothetical protein
MFYYNNYSIYKSKITSDCYDEGETTILQGVINAECVLDCGVPLNKLRFSDQTRGF